MKQYSAYLIIACSIAFLASCKKEDATEGHDGVVKTIDSIAMDTQIGLIPLDDGKFVIVTDSQQIVKIDDKGTVFWSKPITEISDTRAAVAEPGTGFVLFGVPANPPTPASYYACRYDAEGNLLETKQVNINFPISYVEQPIPMIRLANGGFAIATANSFTWFTYLKIFDRDFNIVYSRVFTWPAGYYTFLAQYICELPNGDIAISATATASNSYTSAWIHSVFLLTNPDGTVKSSLIINKDTLVNQAAPVVSPFAGGFFAVTSTKTGWLSYEGTFVNYYGGTQMAGPMQLDLFNAEGQFTGTRPLTGYSGYGVIHSVRKTPDGGYLLCGTAGNNGSSFSVSMTKVYVCRLDANLNEVWAKTFATTYQAIGVDAVPKPDGGFLVTGNMKSFGDDYQVLMIQTDANGNY